MKKNNFFVYTINSRVVWISENIFQIPVINDLYNVYMFEKDPGATTENCHNYTVKSLRSFVQDELVYSEVTGLEREEILLYHEKVKIFLKLCDYINYSYLLSFPPVFESEADKIEVLSKTLVNLNANDADAIYKHNTFTKSVIDDKKTVLKQRFVKITIEIQKATSIADVRKIGSELNFNEVSV